MTSGAARVTVGAAREMSREVWVTLNRFLSPLSRGRIAAVSLALIIAIGLVDFATGYELSFSIFYLIPVSIAAWYAGRGLALPVCILSAATWLAVDFSTGHVYSHATIPYWNALVRLGFFIVVANLLLRLRDAHERLQSAVERDGLTGLLNARAFAQRYGGLAALAARHRHPMALGYMDLDGFKGVNDALGHAAGDDVLQAVASEMERRLRASDVAARLGGDEFAVILPETGIDGARTLFASLRESLIAMAARNRWPVGFSIGVAVFESPPADGESAIRCADDLMYRVKRAGKNNLMFDEL